MDTGFAALARPDARVLILGTLPSQQSMARSEYYANSQNQFWKIMGELVGAGWNLDYESRLGKLKDGRIALWDVYEAAARQGSLDANIKAHSAVVNNFNRFLEGHRELRLICCNGQLAGKIFMRQIQPHTAVPMIVLPSTSPAHTMPYAEKLRIWRAAIEPVLAG